MKLNRLALSLLCSAYQDMQRQGEVCIHSASKSLELQEWEFRRAFQYLLGEGLVERVPGTVNVVKLTSWGLAEARHRSDSGRTSLRPTLFYLGDSSQGYTRYPEAS